MNVLVLGAGGMAGHVVATYLIENGFEVKTVASRHPFNDSTHIIDVTDSLAIKDFLDKNVFDVVVNCIGVLVKQSEERQDLATYLNSYFPHFLERYYLESTTRIIHLSTDCVFSGHKPPYKEDSPYDGSLFYDRSKALGEIINDKDLTFRMSIVGPDMQEDGLGLFNWFMKQEGQISGYTKAVWSGVTTIELAKGIKAAIEQELTGLYHFVPNTALSKFDLLQIFKGTFRHHDINIVPEDGMAIDKTLINTRKDFNFEVSDYRTMVAEMERWIIGHRALYPHYFSDEKAQ